MVIRLEDNLRDKLEKKLKGLGNLEPVMRTVAVLMKQAIWKNFEAEGRDEKGNTRTWQPLAPSTVKQREKYKGKGYGAHPILERTGHLKKSFSTEYSYSYAKVGTGVKYGIYHQTGTRKMPARPMLVLPKEDLENIKKVILRYLTQKK